MVGGQDLWPGCVEILKSGSSFYCLASRLCNVESTGRTSALPETQSSPIRLCLSYTGEVEDSQQALTGAIQDHVHPRPPVVEVSPDDIGPTKSRVRKILPIVTLEAVEQAGANTDV